MNTPLDLHPEDTLTFTLGVNRPRLAALARGERRAEAWTGEAVAAPEAAPAEEGQTACGLCGQLKEPEAAEDQRGVTLPKFNEKLPSQ